MFFKVFNVRLNEELIVVEDLDILSSAGYAIAHDEYIPFTIKGRSLETTHGAVQFTGELVVEFLKVGYDSCTHGIRIVPTSQCKMCAYCEYRLTSLFKF